MYADDLLLLSVSISDLQSLINICVEELDLIDVVLNTSKSVCMRIGMRRLKVAGNLLVNDSVLKWSDEIRYLGITIVSANSFKCNLQGCRQKFFRALNAIYSKIGTRAEVGVLLKLFEPFCIPIKTYNTEAIKLNEKDFKYLESACSLTFGKTFGTYHTETLRLCQ